ARLVRELQRLLADQEKKDSQALMRYSRKAAQGTHLTSWQSFGFLIGAGGVALALLGLAFKDSAVFLELAALVLIAGGGVAIKLGAYRDTVELPVPDYSVLVRPPIEQTNLQEKEKAIEAELSQRLAAQPRRRRESLCVQESYAALNACDYLR